jgi:hypothetical protein
MPPPALPPLPEHSDQPEAQQQLHCKPPVNAEVVTIACSLG